MRRPLLGGKSASGTKDAELVISHKLSPGGSYRLVTHYLMDIKLTESADI